MLVPYSEEISEFLSEYDELVKLLPYAKHAIAVYKLVRLKRMELFLRSLDKVAERMTPEQRKQLEKILNSEMGQHILAEYVDSLIRTSSQTAIVAFAFLYADVENSQYSLIFKQQAALSLSGISEELVALFLALSGNLQDLKKDDQGPFPVYFCGEKFIRDSNDATLQAHFGIPDALTAAIYELIQRRLLIPDYASSRFGGAEWHVPFGFSKSSEQFAKLLLRARRILAQT